MERGPMSKLLSVNECTSHGLPSLTVRDSREVHSRQLWSKCKVRISGVCDASGERYGPGAEIYRPVGNSSNRSMRILADLHRRGTK